MDLIPRIWPFITHGVSPGEEAMQSTFWGPAALPPRPYPPTRELQGGCRQRDRCATRCPEAWRLHEGERGGSARDEAAAEQRGVSGRGAERSAEPVSSEPPFERGTRGSPPESFSEV